MGEFQEEAVVERGGCVRISDDGDSEFFTGSDHWMLMSLQRMENREKE